MTRLIDADEMLKRLESWNTDDEMDKALYNFTLSRIIEQPTVDAQPVRHGTWRHYERMLTCSECGTVFYDDIMEYFGEEVPRYCPECGARMDL